MVGDIVSGYLRVSENHQVDKTSEVRLRFSKACRNLVLLVCSVLFVLVSSSANIQISVEIRDHPSAKERNALQRDDGSVRKVGEYEGAQVEHDETLCTQQVKFGKQFVPADRSVKLGFLHIPKTGGSSIEVAGAKQAKLSWGYCNHVANAKLCPQPPKCAKNHLKRRIVDWHVPLQELSAFTEAHSSSRCHYYMRPTNTSKKTVELFAVVRNPYERMVSEFFYRMGISVRRNPVSQMPLRRVKPLLNFFLQKKIEKAKLQDTLPIANRSYDGYYTHFIPQYRFIFDGNHRVVDHVLQYESLGEQFEGLMSAFHLNVTLNDTSKVKASRATARFNFSVQELLNSNTRMAINSYFEKDFCLFGYEFLKR